MSELLTEFLTDILTEAADPKPANAKYSSGGKWYTADPESGGEYVGRIEKGKWVAATDAEKEQEKQKTVPQKSAAPQPALAPKQEPKQKEPADKVGQPTGKSVDVKTASKQLYGNDGRGKLLLNSPTAQQVLDKGFIAGEGAPPGSAGSNFNENMSSEGSLILQRYPDMDEETLTRVLFDRVRKSALAKQQKKVGAKGSATYPSSGKTRLPIPADIKDEQEKIIYQNCLIAARSGRKKYARSIRGVGAAQKAVGFGKIQERRCFGGAQDELSAAKTMVQNAKRCFVFDEELGIVELPKEVLVQWINNSGGGKNAADTVAMTIDSQGNLIYDGWSDKKTLADIQGNSSLRDEYTKMSDIVLDMVDRGRISDDDAAKVSGLLAFAQDFSDELESKYADTSAQLADTFLQPAFISRAKVYIALAKNDDIVGKGRFNEFAKKIKVALGKEKGTEVEKKIREAAALGKKKGYAGDKLVWYVLNKVAESKMLTGNERKILERVALTQVEVQKEKNKGKLPKQFARLEIKASLRRLRSEAILFQREHVDKLNKIKVKNAHGDTVRLGDHLKAREIINILHLDKIEIPKKPGPNASAEELAEYHEQVLVRSTQLMMEGIPVDPKTIRGCLGVDTTREFEQNFDVVWASSGSKDALDGEDGGDGEGVEGSTVYIYAIGKGGKKTLVARKSYRSKQGDTGKTGTTIQWEPDMQNCFDKKGAAK